MLTATLTARVFEHGGRATTEAVQVPVDLYPAYVGIREPQTSWVRSGQPLALQLILVAADGRPISGRNLEVRVYQNERNWWWEYRSFDDYRLRFKSDVSTRQVATLTTTSATTPVELDYVPDRHGQILVEVRDPQGGHSAGVFLWVSSWGSQSAPLASGTQLEMEMDHERYHPGETARVAVTTPQEGIAFVSVEKGDRILEHRWLPLTDSTTTIDVPITREMLPNAYLHVLAIQPHAQTTNDRPLRLHGVVSIPVEEASTRLQVEVEAPSLLGPREEFEVLVQLPSRRRSTVTVAVVEEGLLDLTNFGTPDPWRFFYAKERLSVASFDIYDAVIGAGATSAIDSRSVETRIPSAATVSAR